MKKLKKLLGLFIPFAMGGVIGGFAAASIAEMPYPIPVKLALLFVGVVLGMYFQIAIHEAGHLAGGLMSGYKFVSYRIGSLMLTRINGKLELKRYSVAGTGGQCLMAPPDMQNGIMPVILYNIAGPLANIIAAAIFGTLYFVIPEPAVGMLCMMMAVIGLFFGLTNGIPMRGVVDNDGRNALSLGKNPAAMRVLWVQLKINEYMSQSIRLKDMPKELFEMPETNDMNNALVASLPVFRANMLMDSHDFEAADELMTQLVTMKSALPARYKSLLNSDRATCAVIAGKNGEELLSKDDKKIMRAMKTSLGVIRTEYALALYKKDAAKAEKLLKSFEKIAKNYPYPGEEASERELVDIVRAALTNELTQSIM